MTLGINFGAADEAAKSLRKAADDLRKQRSTLQEQMDGLNTQREGLYLQALSKADAKQFLFDYIDAWAEQYLSRGKLDELFQIVANPKRDEDFAKANNLTVPYLCLRDIEIVLATGAVPQGGQLFRQNPLPVFGEGTANMHPSYIGSACFFFGDLIKAKLEKYFDARYPEPNPHAVGAPVTERRALIKDLDRQIGELKGAVGQIDGKLSQLNIHELHRIPGVAK